MSISKIDAIIPVIKYIWLINFALKRNRIINKSKNIMNPVNNKLVKIYNITLQRGPISAHLNQNKRSNIE